MQRRVRFQQARFRARTLFVGSLLGGYRSIRRSTTVPLNLT
jgi:hypothetical protein